MTTVMVTVMATAKATTMVTIIATYRNDYKRFWRFARNLNIVLGLDSTSELASLEPLRTETHVKTRGRAGCESGD